MFKAIWFLLCAAALIFSVPAHSAESLSTGLVDVQSINPDIRVEARYATEWNFVGRPIEGYRAGRCYLTKKAANALSKVQKEVAKQKLSLLVFDCYRPQRAVTQFVSWTKDPTDGKMKSFFYPDEPKDQLIARGYIDAKSGHSRGSTVDLTLVKTSMKHDSSKILQYRESGTDCRRPVGIEKTGQLDMGTAYDCFSEVAHTANPTVSAEARKNRELLKAAMERAGFSNYPKEWWHFTLKDEPHKDQYFDFEIQ